jgi:hypothetical protein
MSAFKQLYSDMISSGGAGAIPKKTIKCYVKESFPHFLVTDGFFYVACYFTKKAVDEFHSKFSNMNITDLRSRVITITDWTLEMNKVNSANVFTSYGGVEVRLIVKSFKPVIQEKDQPTLTRHPVNLYRDDEVKTLIQNYTHSCIGSSLGSREAGLPDVSKMSAKAGVAQGVHSFASGATFSSWNFKEGKTATVDLASIFKQEKGADALRRFQAGPSASGKAKVVGGAKKAGKGKGKTAGAGIGGIIEKIAKFTPGDKQSAAQKKSTTRILTKAPTLASPGGDKHAGTTDYQSMKDFQKMISFLKKNKGAALGKRGGKGSTAKQASGRKSQK